MDDLNPSIIEEFRSNGGKVGGPFAGKNMLLLQTIGVKSHQPRINPLGYMKDGDAFVVVASKGGAHTNPDWYHNILAHPEVWLEVGTERFKAHATIPERQERDRLFANFVEQEPGFGEYQKNTSRILPVVILKRV
ncbi:MAG: nitroreductase family deazaflavin-dependent oxidoreductase [Ktedonobacteraceae bacterium]|nr:nitroreductase family deazaflavin-dependent oxidoreductase [Ktedonobacteraceae bacterium]